MDAELKQYLDDLSRKFDLLVNHFELTEMRHIERYERIEARLATLEQSMAALDARMAALDARMAALDARMATLEERMDGLEARMAALEERMDGLEARQDRSEGRLDRLERRLDTLEAQVREGFIGVYERFGAMALGIEQFERRVQSSITEMQQDITKLRTQVDSLIERTGRLEDAVLHQAERLNGFHDDMRQRLRVVNERLAELAA